MDRSKHSSTFVIGKRWPQSTSRSKTYEDNAESAGSIPHATVRFFFALIFFGRWGTSLSAYSHPIVLCVQNAIISSMVRAIPSLMQGLGIPNHAPVFI